jgi:uncharacterized protein
MLNISSLFGKSPFAPLKSHMNKVNDCVMELYSLLKAIESQNMGEIKEIAAKISKFEHDADLAKNEIRKQLPKGIFLPIHKLDLLEILALQDAFANRAEDIAAIATFIPLSNYADMKEDFEFFYKENIESFSLAKDVVDEFDNLIESSFGGIEAEKVKIMITELAYKEHELDNLQYSLEKKLYDLSGKMHYSLFNAWITLIKEVGKISNLGEKLGNHILIILDSK